jgi:hypothetical protein
MEPSEVHDRFSRVTSLEDPRFELKAASEVELALEVFSLCLGQVSEI